MAATGTCWGGVPLLFFWALWPPSRQLCIPSAFPWLQENGKLQGTEAFSVQLAGSEAGALGAALLWACPAAGWGHKGALRAPDPLCPLSTGRASLHDKASLRLEQVRAEDQGWYECKVLLLDQQYDTFHNGSWVHLTIHGACVRVRGPVRARACVQA